MRTRILHILGTGSGVGKSSLCLGLLAWLAEHGVPGSELSYIKPITQCVDRQAVASFCARHGVVCRDIGPVVFSKGFTRRFLNSPTVNRKRVMEDVLRAVDATGRGRRFLIVDGVGHPAVGSTIGLSQPMLAKALGDSRILLVGPPGIGAAIDDVMLCLTYLKAKGVSDVGILFNKVDRSLAAEMAALVGPVIKREFPQTAIHGFLPVAEKIWTTAGFFDVAGVAAWLGEHVDVDEIVGGREKGG